MSQDAIWIVIGVCISSLLVFLSCIYLICGRSEDDSERPIGQKNINK